jgi:hypothetical protein
VTLEIILRDYLGAILRALLTRTLNLRPIAVHKSDFGAFGQIVEQVIPALAARGIVTSFLSPERHFRSESRVLLSALRCKPVALPLI